MILKAGIILINNNKIALIYRDYYDDYTFPKGHLEENESLIECAIRETNEEIKREVNLISEKEIYVENYVDSNNNKCKCYYYLGYDNGKSINNSNETHDLLWVSFDEVYNKLSYDSLKKMWKEVKDEVFKYIKK